MCAIPSAIFSNEANFLTLAICSLASRSSPVCSATLDARSFPHSSKRALGIGKIANHQIKSGCQFTDFITCHHWNLMLRSPSAARLGCMNHLLQWTINPFDQEIGDGAHK